MSNIVLPISDDGLTTRTFKPVGENGNIVVYETRDANKRSLESSLHLSSTHLTSGATKVSGKLQHVVTETVETIVSQSGQNLVKLDVIISDNATQAQRNELANMLVSLATAVKSNIDTLDPIYL